MSDKIIVSIDQIRKLKQEKEKELAYYKDHLEELQIKISWLEADLRLTTDIIKMIEEESVMTIDSNSE